MPAQKCRREPLARSPICKVDACSCGLIHVTTGAVTLRFKAEAFEEFAATMTEARWRRPTQAARGLRLVHTDSEEASTTH
jgi:hypothetical protein